MSSSAHIRHLFRSSLLIAILVTGCFFASEALAVTGSMPITGYAWSSNAGWISFSGPTYGVFEDKATGALSGYAWSSNIGWISFNVPDGGHPAPVINLTDGKASGYARACAAFSDKNLCSGALDANTAGWDGWIALGGTAADSSIYGMVQGLSCAWTGYGWGSDAIGAVSASGVASDSSAYGLTGNDPSVCAGTCANLAGNPPTCTQCIDGQYYNGTSCAVCGGTGCSGIGGNTTGNPNGSLTCNNFANNPPTCSLFTPVATFASSTMTIDQGQTATFTWSSTGSTSCTGTGFPVAGTSTIATSGSYTTPVLNTPGTQSYQLFCTGPGGQSPTAVFQVEVLSPGATISANPSRVTVAASTTQVIWAANGVNSCAVTGPSGTIVPSTPANPVTHVFATSSQIFAISGQSKFTITCQTNGPQVTKSITVNLTGTFQQF
jgi:hypothetical protein